MKIGKTRTTTSISENPSSNKRTDSGGRILTGESVHFVSRLQEVIGDESVSSFSRRSHVNEGTIRNVIAGAWPRTDNLVAMADAGGVSVDWLATGRGPKHRAALHVSEPDAHYGQALDLQRLRLALTMAEDAAAAIPEKLAPERRAELVITFYQRLGESDEYKR